MKQKQYAKVIREKRKALGWTQKELVEKIFSTQQAVARWENSVTEPNLDSLIALSRALGTPVSHFLDNVVVKIMRKSFWLSIALLALKMQFEQLII